MYGVSAKTRKRGARVRFAQVLRTDSGTEDCVRNPNTPASYTGTASHSCARVAGKTRERMGEICVCASNHDFVYRPHA